MSEPFDIQSYMTHGVERVVGDIIKATFRNPKESAYMAKFALASRAASRKRRKAEDAGEHKTLGQERFLLRLFPPKLFSIRPSSVFT